MVVLADKESLLSDTKWPEIRCIQSRDSRPSKRDVSACLTRIFTKHFVALIVFSTTLVLILDEAALGLESFLLGIPDLLARRGE